MGKLQMENFLNYKKIKDVKNLITKNQYDEIKKLFNYYDTVTIKNRLTNIRDFIINGVENRWLGRLKIITKKLKNDVISDYSCKVRYGDKWKERQDILKEKVKHNLEKYIEKHGKEEGLKMWNNLNMKRRSYGKEIMIERYGEEEGKKKWENTLKRKINTMSERKKINPYRNGRTLIEYQERYGINDGYLKWKKRNDKQKYRFSIDYYKDMYNEEWEEKWVEYIQSMSKTSLEKFILRYGEDLGKVKYDEFIFKQIECLKVRPNYSKISQELFFKITEELNCYENSYFAENKGEYIFYISELDNAYGILRLIQVDFKLGNKIIEFDGDYWHSKQEQIEKDKIRDEYLTNKGYLLKRIKETDYKNNKDQIIKECIEFLKNE